MRVFVGSMRTHTNYARAATLVLYARDYLRQIQRCSDVDSLSEPVSMPGLNRPAVCAVVGVARRQAWHSDAELKTRLMQVRHAHGHPNVEARVPAES